MDATSVDIWGEVRRLKLEFGQQIVGLSPNQWEMPSWCAGWRIRDVLGHVVQNAEATQLSMFCQIIRNPVRPDRVVDRLARKLGAEPVPELVERLRRAADRQFRLIGTPPEMGLGDLLVHQVDALRPAGIDPDPPTADVLVALDVYKKWGRRVFHAVPHRDVTLVASDANWRIGTGAEVTGKAIDLLMLVANRRQVIERLEGPGLAQLTS